MRLRYAAFALTGMLLGLAGCMGTQSAAETTVVTAARPAKPALPVTVDVEQLVGLSIDEVRQVLGPARKTRASELGLEPTAEQLHHTNGEGWINTFEHNGQTILVAFNARTRKVRDMVLLGNNEQELLQRTNLSLASPRYIVLPFAELDSADNERVVGVRIVARN
ncbi:hypothetical protein HMJ29_00250 [Hymenobacter taeanensis]|uniref:Uncharacterized protein n=1 Tax=Hymenobacter taeanensis TaxID=2735321 RepID=A0A6M6BBC2_9BACT|nr:MULTISPECIES: hypothetical protein [Hymenobacter]QJX45447.1 hypothetical protein HMJ29_00250 [Hymenobacter taeanensis]UOQ81307.1 hypothetical protein MUN83_00455 [Hymenobacter sp. 5414T-23]